ncbi:hypothetical protein MBM_01666 [Drepanopeziza brunnea f. sp. 'multigermtubi' MB_m1]|uniref:Uncharacterized protein n=1 Tax=Marssonina brunnea f. sp. multigermtubi (strain MB_m1) TaxID=1072389 RepID=K1Y3I1_MARBU|nr:uncharacterized protein MBM_01666 [Drepanopeziza brunnea f. sp. 'multigermtubi' MB_m1]EKD19714.1 hypothetical protein MBM_01666 [Drepanopeziza brunnea f. sp. 'multigermtubi' MB_m1]
MLRSKSTLAILLALSFLFNGAQAWFTREVIGYAMIPRSEADEINELNELHSIGGILGSENSQLGNGLILLNDPRVFRDVEGYSYCVIKAKKDKMKRIGKVYVPYSDGQTELWNSNEMTIRSHIYGEDLVEFPNTALRFAWLRGRSRQPIVLIPSTVIQLNYLKLWGKCYSTPDKLLESWTEVVKWSQKSSWTIKGDPGEPHE